MKNIVLISLLITFFCCCAPEAKKYLIPENYASWKRTTNVELNYPIPGHLEHYRKIYINEIGEKVEVTVVDGKKHYNYPTGTIIVKEVYPALEYKEGDKPGMLTIMIKDPSHPQARGGWLWIVQDLKNPLNEYTVFTSDFCIDCHTDANRTHSLGPGNPDEEFRDYVFFPYNADNK
jgi:hypothetical protein